MFGMVIHGGAGTLPRAEMSGEAELRYRAGLHEAIDAERRVGEARRHMHISGVAAGWIDPGTPPPARPNMASARFENSALFVQIKRAPRQTF